jgi:hypothetical protein
MPVFSSFLTRLTAVPRGDCERPIGFVPQIALSPVVPGKCGLSPVSHPRGTPQTGLSPKTETLVKCTTLRWMESE